MSEITETFTDSVVGFSVPPRDARGRIARLDKTATAILSAHDYPPAVAHLLTEALVLISLVGSLLKNDGSQVTMQAQTQGGPIRLLVCDYKAGQIRGYVDFDADRIGALGTSPNLTALFGEGYLALTFDVAKGEQTDKSGRYQGIVPLEGASLSEACQSYFMQSEQVPTLIRVAVSGGEGEYRAAGLLVQYLPEGEEGRERLHVRLDHPEWEHVAIMAGSVRYEELLDLAISLEGIVWRLFHEEEQVRVQRSVALTKGCRCTVEHYRRVLSRFPSEQRDSMADDHGNIIVDCEFCSQKFPIPLDQLVVQNERSTDV
ncbi:Hsp33 family molecular chaperone HslO [Qipengyuania atrilutea]|uniref:Hsp33 family molecular chaperone HslO n=1 Tax=Qipengyuania atrilutea TaxID=2744473 RepID=A0A850H1U1_9SPHN|nr:Hsp33 family molecular chaperone HslO [Actirhodobacter atriluteus]NVD44656.1 Hsp33 family molecular chaperone HslO [Actirhodobacter atriluteus]